MHAYQLTIKLHDLLFYASRELGRTYISERYLHNYALTYALGFATSSYHDSVQVPHYREDLESLNELGVYVTPAKPIRMETAQHTFKFADNRYSVKMEPSSVNIPTFGRVREVMPESSYEAFVLAQEPQMLPRWIRLGKWLSKAAVHAEELEVSEGQGDFISQHPLNRLDVPPETDVKLYDLINMPPVSLIEHARLHGAFYRLKKENKEITLLPKGLAYTF